MFLTPARLRPLVAGVAFILSAETSALAQDTVTTCGQLINRSATLANDLDCTGMTFSVDIQLGATLTLAGHTITGAEITCGNCVIQGPGTIAGAYGGGLVVRTVTSNDDIYAYRELTLVDATVNGVAGGYERAYVENCTITGDDGGKVGVQANSLTMIDSTVTHHGLAGVRCGVAKISGSTISDNGWNGIDCGKLTIENSELTGNGFKPDPGGLFTTFAIDCYTLAKIVGTQITGNKNGVIAEHLVNAGNVVGRVQLTDSLVDGNEHDGVKSMRVSINNSNVTNNGCVGASGVKKLRFETSVITGNGAAVGCSRPVDVFSRKTPILKTGASCGTSLGDGENYDESWGVCSLD